MLVLQSLQLDQLLVFVVDLGMFGIVCVWSLCSRLSYRRLRNRLFVLVRFGLVFLRGIVRSFVCFVVGFVFVGRLCHRKVVRIVMNRLVLW